MVRGNTAVPGNKELVLTGTQVLGLLVFSAGRLMTIDQVRGRIALCGVAAGARRAAGSSAP